MRGSKAVAEARSPLAFFGQRPRVTGVAGALCIASSGVLVRLADVSPATAATFRCLYALPLLALLTRIENVRFGPRPRRARLLALSAGLFFGADLVFWHHAIAAVGAGLATVLGNLQVLIVGLLAWLILSERPPTPVLLALPVVLCGVVLISGVVGEDAYGRDPLMGVVYGGLTSVAYGAFILILRQGSADLRRPAGPLFDATLASAAATLVYGVIASDLDPVPSWPSHGWLLALALSAQVTGWLLISTSLPRLPAALISMLLLVQPVGALALGAVILGESPSPVQLAGAALILVGVVVASRRRKAPVVPEEGVGTN